MRQTGMSTEMFVYSCPNHASARQSVSAFVEALFAAFRGLLCVYVYGGSGSKADG